MGGLWLWAWAKADADGICCRDVRQRREAGAYLYGNIVHYRGDILGKIIDRYLIKLGRGAGRLQNHAPLNKTGSGNLEARVLGHINSRPRTPVAVRIVYVAAASEDFIVATGTHFCATPSREDVRVLNVALECALSLRAVAHEKNFSQIAAGTIESAVSCLAERADLVGAALEQILVVPVGGNGVNASLISCPGDQAAGGIKCQRIDDIVGRRPDLPWRTVRSDHINV